MTTTTEIKIYWDSTDPDNEGWAWRTDGDSGSLDAAADELDGAIRETCSYLGVDLTPDQFAREPYMDGGFAIWSA